MRKLALVLALVIAAASLGPSTSLRASDEQRRGGRGGFGVRRAVPEDFDGSYQFCRVEFRQSRAGDGGSWGVDYPRADINMSIRLGELTKTRVAMHASGDPRHLVVRMSGEPSGVQIVE